MFNVNKDDLDMVTSIIIHFYLYRVIFVYKEHLLNGSYSVTACNIALEHENNVHLFTSFHL